MQHRVGDRQQVRLEGIEAQPLQRQRQVLAGRLHGRLERQPDNVQRPEVVVFQALPEEFGRDGLPVVHGAFAGVFSDDAVDHDDFLAGSQ